MVEDDELPEYLDQREAAIRAGCVPPTRIDLKDGRRVLYSCIACPDGGRILTYTDISHELLREATEAAAFVKAELRFRMETLEDLAAYLAALAESAHQNARNIEEARQELESRVTRQTELEGELHRLAAGDSALRHFVTTLRAGVRDIDQLGRAGGEEFALLIPSMPIAGAEYLAERLRLRVPETLVPFSDTCIRMTVSIGLAGQEAEDCNIEQTMVRADAALNEAKRTGRNRVVRYRACEAA